MNKRRERKKRFKFYPFLISLTIPLCIEFSTSFFNTPRTIAWYNSLIKPPFNPPSWIFAPVWVVLYILIGIAGYLVWQSRKHTSAYRMARDIYCVQLTLNFFWSMIFFGMMQIISGLIVLFLLWLAIILNIIWFFKFSKVATCLLIPYFLWVTFALLLNLSILILNR